MTMTAANGSNTYVPEVTEKLRIEFSHNDKGQYPINEYLQIVPVDKQVGLYPKMDREEAGRLMRTNGSDRLWAPGKDRPSHNGKLEEFEFKAYKTTRYEDGFNLDRLAVEQCRWDEASRQANVVAERTMRFRALKAATAATTSGNYDSTHVSAVSSITGVTGKWDLSTVARMDIKRSLDFAAEKIIQDSLNGIGEGELILVMNLTDARKISVTQEIVDMLKQSNNAAQYLQGELNGFKNRFKLPKFIHGYKLVVEDTVRVTSRKGAATRVNGYVVPNGSAFMCSRVGGLVDNRNSETPSFSTHIAFVKEDMVVEQRDDDWNRKHLGSMVDDFEVQVAAPVSGFLFTSITQ